jgi:exopolysaccharide production protein ExoQ
MALLFLCGLDLTGSRTAMIAFVLSTLFGCILLFFRRAARRGRLMHIAVLTACGLALCTTVIVSFASVRSMLLAGVTEPRDEGNPEELTGRVPLWRVCETYASGHMLFGYGYDAFWSPKHIDDISAELRWAINEAHSAYVDMVLMSGVPAVLLYLVFLTGAGAMGTRSFWKGDNKSGVWAVIMVFALIHGLTEAITLPITYPSYLILTGILWWAQRNLTSPAHYHAN